MRRARHTRTRAFLAGHGLLHQRAARTEDAGQFLPCEKGYLDLALGVPMLDLSIIGNFILPIHAKWESKNQTRRIPFKLVT